MIQHCLLALDMYEGMFSEGFLKLWRDCTFWFGESFNLGVGRHHLHAQLLTGRTVCFMDLAHFCELHISKIQFPAQPFKFRKSRLAVVVEANGGGVQAAALNAKEGKCSGTKASKENDEDLDHGGDVECAETIGLIEAV